MCGAKVATTCRGEPAVASYQLSRFNIRSQRAVVRIGAVREESRTDGSGHENYAFQLTPEAWVRSPRTEGE